MGPSLPPLFTLANSSHSCSGVMRGPLSQLRVTLGGHWLFSSPFDRNLVHSTLKVYASVISARREGFGDKPACSHPLMNPSPHPILRHHKEPGHPGAPFL